MGAHKSNGVPLYNKKSREGWHTSLLLRSHPQIIFRGASLRLHARPPVFGRGHTSLLLHAPIFFLGGGRRTSWLLPPRAMNPIVTPLTFAIIRLCTRLLRFQQLTNQPSFPTLFFDVHSLCSTQNTYTYTVTSSRISGYSNGSEGRIAADAAHMSCIGLRLQGGPKKLGPQTHDHHSVKS